MKYLFSILFILLIQAALTAQKLPEWYRVYTFDDESLIELKTDYVMFSDHGSGRVKLRWTFTEPQKLEAQFPAQFQSILEEVAFDCANQKYSVYETRWTSAEGKEIAIESKKKDAEWLDVTGGYVMKKIYTPACGLIALRKREPLAKQ